MNKAKAKPSPPPPASGALLNFSDGSYLEATSRPLYALCFLLPLLVVYEVGTLLVNTQQFTYTFIEKRVVTFVWLEQFGQWVGFGPRFAWLFPGFVVVLILLCWHLASRRSWQVNISWVLWMGAEAVLLCFPLFAVSAVMHRVAAMAETALQAAAPADGGYLANLVTSLGAGIYEELFFRLIVMGVLLGLLDDILKVRKPVGTIVAVAISAGLFSAHHYIGYGPEGLQVLETFRLESFLFRTVAGLYFALLFRYRGYGVTAGTHAAYNVVLHTFT